MNTEPNEKTIKTLLQNFFEVLNFTNEQKEKAIKDIDDLIKAKMIDIFLGSLGESDQKELKSKIENKASAEELIKLIDDYGKKGNFEQSAQEVLTTFIADYIETMSRNLSVEQKKEVSDLLTQF